MQPGHMPETDLYYWNIFWSKCLEIWRM